MVGFQMVRVENADFDMDNFTFDEFGDMVPKKVLVTIDPLYRPSQYQLDFPELFQSDTSINPSYTGLFTLPYNVICRLRLGKFLKEAFKEYWAEIRKIELCQSFALEGVRVHRVFCEAAPISNLRQMPHPLTPKQRKRVNDIIEGVVVFN